MIYYSEKYAAKQRLDRDAMIERAKDLIRHPKTTTGLPVQVQLPT